jgi:hypothetical protein
LKDAVLSRDLQLRDVDHIELGCLGCVTAGLDVAVLAFSVRRVQFRGNVH